MVFGLFENSKSFEQWYRKFSGRGFFKTLNPAKQVEWLAKNHPEWVFNFIKEGKSFAGNSEWTLQKVLTDIFAYPDRFAVNFSDFSSMGGLSGTSGWSRSPAEVKAKSEGIFALGAALSTYERAFAFAKGLGENAPLFVDSVWPAFVGEDSFVRGLGKNGCNGFLDGLSVKDAMRLGIHLSKFLKPLSERDVQKFASRFDETTCLYLISPPQTPSNNEHDKFRSYMGFKDDLGFRLEAFARGLSFKVLQVLFSRMDDGFGDFLAGFGDRIYLFGKGIGLAQPACAGSAGRGLGVDLKNILSIFDRYSVDLSSFFRGLGHMRVIFAMGCLDEISKLDPKLALQVASKFESAPGFLEGLDEVSLRDWQKVKASHLLVNALKSSQEPISISPLSSASKCLYCSDDLREDDAVLECDVCHVVLHNACAESHGNVCPTMGCQGRLYAVASRRSARPRQSLK